VDGGAGERGLHFQTGSPLLLRLELQARDPVDDLVVGFSIHRPDGMQLSGTNTQLERLQVPKRDAGDCLSLAYSVEQLALLDGVYRLDVAAVSGSTSTTFEWIQNAARFSVTDVVGRSGIFHLRGAWEPPVSAPMTVGSLREAGG